MTSQARKTILAALITQLSQVNGINLVDSAYRYTDEIPDDKYPAILLTEKESVYPNVPTSLQFVRMTVEIELCTKNKEVNGVAPEDISRDLHEAIIDKLNDDVTIGGTCRYFDFIGSEQPFYWRLQGVFLVYLRIMVEYRRDV